MSDCMFCPASRGTHLSTCPLTKPAKNLDDGKWEIVEDAIMELYRSVPLMRRAWSPATTALVDAIVSKRGMISNE